MISFELLLFIVTFVVLVALAIGYRQGFNDGMADGFDDGYDFASSASEIAWRRTAHGPAAPAAGRSSVELTIHPDLLPNSTSETR